jgi:hypothetical protein
VHIGKSLEGVTAVRWLSKTQSVDQMRINDQICAAGISIFARSDRSIRRRRAADCTAVLHRAPLPLHVADERDGFRRA